MKNLLVGILLVGSFILSSGCGKDQEPIPIEYSILGEWKLVKTRFEPPFHTNEYEYGEITWTFDYDSVDIVNNAVQIVPFDLGTGRYAFSYTNFGNSKKLNIGGSDYGFVEIQEDSMACLYHNSYPPSSKHRYFKR
jgi:hypothetical protein